MSSTSRPSVLDLDTLEQSTAQLKATINTQIDEYFRHIKDQLEALKQRPPPPPQQDPGPSQVETGPLYLSISDAAAIKTCRPSEVSPPARGLQQNGQLREPKQKPLKPIARHPVPEQPPTPLAIKSESVDSEIPLQIKQEISEEDDKGGLTLPKRIIREVLPKIIKIEPTAVPDGTPQQLPSSSTRPSTSQEPPRKRPIDELSEGAKRSRWVY